MNTNNRKLKVLVIGTVNIENQFFLDSKVRIHQANVSANYVQIFGSKALNAARAICAFK